MRILLKLSLLCYILGVAGCLGALLVLVRQCAHLAPHSMWLAGGIIAALVLGRSIWEACIVYRGIAWKGNSL